MKRLLFILAAFVANNSWAADNQIYIEQTVTSTDSQIDLRQIGGGNIIAKSNDGSVAMKLNGSNLDFSLWQIGDSNKFLSDINVSSSNFDIDWTGDSNTFTGLFNSAGTYSMLNTDFDNLILGGNNTLTVSIAEGADATDSTLNWYINGSDNTVTLEAATFAQHNTKGDFNAADSSNMNLDWDINGSNNTATVIIQSKYVTQDWDITGNYNNVDYIGINNSSATSGNGHSSTLNLTGDYWDVNIQQRSSSNNDMINFTGSGSGTSGTPATLCIIQNDSGTNTGC